MFKNNYDPFVTSQSIKHDIVESKYSLIIRFYHFFFFGNGNPFVPLFWLLVLLISFNGEDVVAPTNSVNPSAYLFNIAIFIEMVANLYFGYYFCKHHQMARIILYYEEKYCLDKDLITSYFNYTSTIFLVGVLLVILMLLVEEFIAMFVLNHSDDYHVNLSKGFNLISTLFW